jgi:hypothetical protein
MASKSRQGLFIAFVVLTVMIGVSLVGSENREIILTVASSKVLKQSLGSPINLVNSSGFSITLAMYYGKDSTNIEQKNSVEKNSRDNLGIRVTDIKAKLSNKKDSLNEKNRKINDEKISDSRFSDIPNVPPSTVFKAKTKAEVANATAKNEAGTLRDENVGGVLTDGYIDCPNSTKIEASTNIDSIRPSSMTRSKIKSNVTVKSLHPPDLETTMLGDPLELENLTAVVAKTVLFVQNNQTNKYVLSKTNRTKENLNVTINTHGQNIKLNKKPTAMHKSELSGGIKADDFSKYALQLQMSMDNHSTSSRQGKDQYSFHDKSIHRFSKSLKLIAFNSSLSPSYKARLFPITNPQDSRVTAVYNAEALNKLNRIKEKIKQGEKITLVMNGGSSSAFVPNGTPDDRFYLRFVNDYLKSELNAKVNIIDRAHGSRNSAHSAHLMTSFLPHQEVDILLWEFSINDGTQADDVRNAFILWLRNVASRSTSPPLVILVYLWKSPFSVDKNGKVYCRTFEQHDMIGAEYDFVLGHVNVAAYLDSLRWDAHDLKAAFLADAHHPNALTHHIVAKLLSHLVSKASESFTPIRKHVPANKTDIKWVCGNETKDKKLLESFFNETKGIAKASFTADFPRNEEGTNPFMLVPQYNNSFKYMSFGKVNDQRSDRQNGLIIPCCQSNSFVEFNLTNIQQPKAIMVSLRCDDKRKEWLRIRKNGQFLDSKPNLIRPWNWKCLLGGYNMNIGELPSLDVDFWFPESTLNQIGFCDSKCDPTQPLPLVYISVF